MSVAVQYPPGGRVVHYLRHEPRHPAELVSAPLMEFVLDVPNLIYRGVVPPFALLNAVLGRGGGDAGMSPGASWEPFMLSIAEYEQLVVDLLSADLDRLRAWSIARFVPPTITVRPQLDGCRTLVEWVRRVKQT